MHDAFTCHCTPKLSLAVAADAGVLCHAKDKHTSAPVVCAQGLPEVTHEAQARRVAGIELHPQRRLKLVNHLTRHWRQLTHHVTPAAENTTNA
jgi:hypothetical protein